MPVPVSRVPLRGPAPGEARAARPSSRARIPAVGVLALQGDVAEHLAALRSSGSRPVPVRRPAELDDVDGLVIPGGESTTIWKLAAMFGLAEPVRKRIGSGLPTFGSCAGMIMLAGRVIDGIPGQEVLGAIDMSVRRNAFGRQADSFESDIVLSGVPGPAFRAVFIRAPWVEEAGPDVEIIATEPRTGRIVAVRQGTALATAFHPELTPDLRIHSLFVDIVKEQS
jgi:5'-phosphate synthase pdxT subunit